jgi:hypothetical protein
MISKHGKAAAPKTSAKLLTIQKLLTKSIAKYRETTPLALKILKTSSILHYKDLIKRVIIDRFLIVSILSILLLGCKQSVNTEGKERKFYSLDTQQVMLKHMSSKLTDQELRDLWEKAEIERQAQIENFQKEARQFYASREETLALCKDIAFKTKNPEKCSAAALSPLNLLSGPPVYSQQEIYNGFVVGPCKWVGIEKAEELGCFPKGYKPTLVTFDELEASKLTQSK